MTKTRGRVIFEQYPGNNNPVPVDYAPEHRAKVYANDPKRYAASLKEASERHERILRRQEAILDILRKFNVPSETKDILPLALATNLFPDREDVTSLLSSMSEKGIITKTIAKTLGKKNIIFMK